ncbi:uncharacterized protein K441DRAFT_286650 [Cenococcum geophilum 1.58]|uniref:uncharacterized protein n=1 Tax=Cenococcum geophilum 1.58 TaxID=794803 RepID=UPI00358EBFAF|nr:hypothetical protein K441DRAFT_286650 [Cenococcum geophilum 1.58]
MYLTNSASTSFVLKGTLWLRPHWCEETQFNLTFVPNENCEHDRLQWILPYLRPGHVGWSIAAEAAEALYSGEHRFRINAGLLLEFLSKCPLAQGIRPGSLIRKIPLGIDEDAHLIGEGRDKQGHEELIGYNEGESEYQRQPRNQRNALLRKC